MHMKLGTRGLDLIKRYERFIPYTYDDLDPGHPVRQGDKVRGTLTIGYGHTGAHAVAGNTISEPAAVELLTTDASVAVTAVNRLVTRRLNQGQFDALVSLAFNIGTGNFAASTLLKRLNARDDLNVPAEFLKWRKSKGLVLKGLLRRRVAEAALFLED